MMRRAAILLAFALAAVVPACSASPQPIRVGAVYPLTGPQAPGGGDEFRGVRLAVDLVNADGGVSVLEGLSRIDSIRGKLRLVSFAQAQKLVKEGANLYAPGQANPAQPDTTSKVRQGFIEKSNVNSVAEMSKMIEVTRAYTQISALLQQQGDLRKSALDKLADVPA